MCCGMNIFFLVSILRLNRTFSAFLLQARFCRPEFAEVLARAGMPRCAAGVPPEFALCRGHCIVLSA